MITKEQQNLGQKYLKYRQGCYRDWKQYNIHHHTVFPGDFHICCTNVSCFFTLCWSSNGCGYVMILGAKWCSHILKFKSIIFLKNCKTNSWNITGRQSHYQPWEMKAKNERNYLSLFLRLFTIWRLTLEGPRSLSTIKSKSPTGVQIVKKISARRGFPGLCL